MNVCGRPGKSNLFDSTSVIYKLIFVCRISQIELKQCIESLAEELKKTAEQNTVDLDAYVKKLINAKHRVTILSNILQNAQERLNKVHQSIEKESVKRKALLDSQPDITGSVI